MSATLITAVARTARPWSALRRFLALDALVTGANGLAYALFPAPLGRLLGVEEGLLCELGVLLAVYAAAVGLLSSRERPAPAGVGAVVGVNTAWAVLSLAALVLYFEPTTAGVVWIPLQALTVAGFAALQALALRSTTD
ncbi:hypothetical protein [Streptomyces sp. NPDC097619]|uniref:hypothetical protein n=1 Tax=Streptomyces sp. NPDC097619 TaxID=3157228 RepID=UPI0033238741